MEWWAIFSLIFGGFIVLMLLGVPVAIAFLLIDVIGSYFLWGGERGLRQLTLSIYNSVTNFNLLPIPLFILMGDFMFRSGMAPKMMDVLDKWIGRLPGRLSLLAVFGGAIFGALSGAATASAAMLGSVLLPEMAKRGYKHQMSVGPLLGSAGLDIMIPPSALGVVLAALARISIGHFLIAITLPGILMAFIYAVYIIVRCYLQPHLAPLYDVPSSPLSQKIKLTFLYVVPLGTVFFLAIGVIFVGVATPTEAAALGALGCLLLAAAYRKLTWKVLRESVSSVTQVTVMIFIIFTGSTAFSQLLAYSGATQGLVQVTSGLGISPLLTLIMMQIVLLIMGCIMEPLSIIMVTLPIFLPVSKTLGFDPIWFCAIMLLNMQMGNISPPFGLILFVMKAVAPPQITMGQIYRSAYPFLGLDLIAMAIMIIFPQVVLWLPSLMK
jgi:tripartite ATP-independent transporter DctM subunit